MDKLLYRPTEVGDLIGVSRSRAYELIAAGTIPSIKIGSSVRVPAAALRAWIDRQLAAKDGDRETAATIAVTAAV